MAASEQRSPLSLIAAGILLVSPAALATSEPDRAKSTATAAEASFEPLPTFAAPNCVAGWAIDAAGIHRLPDRCPAGDMARVSEPAASLGAAESADCEPAYRFDSDGIRRLLPQCLALDATAAVNSGAMSFTPESTRPACSPPYYVDKAGIRRLRPECF